MKLDNDIFRCKLEDMKQHNDLLQIKNNEKRNRVRFLEQILQKEKSDNTYSDTDTERSNELIRLQASIIRTLRRDIKCRDLAINAKNHCNSKMASNIAVLTEENTKLKKDNDLLTDILLCRCKDNTRQ